MCDCGNIVIKNTSFFKNGKVFNCGCEKRPSRFLDITGWNMWEHGVPDSRLKVLHKTKQNKGSNWYWLCECQCKDKNIIEASEGNLLSGHIKSCGCLSKEVATKRKKYNKYDIFDDYVIGYTQYNNPFYVDKCDYEKIKDIYWLESNETQYNMKRLFGEVNGRNIRQHVYLGFSGYDHINRNELDNRRNNLRKCTIQQNNYNRGIRSNNTSGIIGVSWSNERQKWCAAIRHNNKLYALGRFYDKDEAIKVRLEAEKKYFGEFSPQIHLFEQYGIETPKISRVSDSI